MAHEEFRRDDLLTSLAHIVEECGEVVSAYAKLHRFGPDSVNPLIPEEEQVTNLDWLMSEIEDVERAIKHFRQT